MRELFHLSVAFMVEFRDLRVLLFERLKARFERVGDLQRSVNIVGGLRRAVEALLHLFDCGDETIRLFREFMFLVRHETELVVESLG